MRTKAKTHHGCQGTDPGTRSAQFGLDLQLPTAGGLARPGAGRPTQSFTMRMSNGAPLPYRPTDSDSS